jgi:hypothetical protein
MAASDLQHAQRGYFGALRVFISFRMPASNVLHGRQHAPFDLGQRGDEAALRGMHAR